MNVKKLVLGFRWIPADIHQFRSALSQKSSSNYLSVGYLFVVLLCGPYWTNFVQMCTKPLFYPGTDVREVIFLINRYLYKTNQHKLGSSLLGFFIDAYHL